MKFIHSNIWWGPPKKFDTNFSERKISWLELFYDLVYVIAISRITHHLAHHPNFSGLLDYIYLFIMIFWGWVNGTMYHDLHGSPGVRTRLMTLWQMMIVAALIITLSGPAETIFFRATIAIAVMQFYITYLWWSIGIYDKAHRKFNRPYTICFLISLALIISTLFLQQPYTRIVFYISLVLNYLPPFLLGKKLQQHRIDFNLSTSMTERLGLFMIIIFGEAVLGVINGVTELNDVNFSIWINFGLGILIVFALWWIFFSMVADRETTPGFLQAQKMQLAFVITFMALGGIGASFSRIFHSFQNNDDAHSLWIKNIFGVSLCIFLMGITIITRYLIYASAYNAARKKMQRWLLTTAVIIVALTMLSYWLQLTLFIYLLLLFIILQTIIVAILRIWLKAEVANREGISS
jgi:low temperature requirement protein LtrA